ncbi:hypothetical protein ACPSKX_12280 [Moritella viscosa]
METIYTIDARDHCMLEVMKDCFKLDHEAIYRETNGMFQVLLRTLKRKSINYQELRACLTPSIDKKEVILVFDTLQIDNSWYGGDGSQYFLVYMNNVSDDLLNRLDDGLKEFKPYTGHIDVTFSCFMKRYASVSLVNSFIKHKGIVICSHEDDRDDADNINMPGYAFEENNYKCFSVQDSLFGVFMSYKIERPVFEGFKRDTEFAINSITSNVLAIDDFDVEIENSKLQYLKEKKTGRMKKSQLIQFERKELEALIRSKVSDNYLYNMTYLEEHGTAKFNVLIEKEVSDGMAIRLMVALEYMPIDRKLRLITMV